MSSRQAWYAGRAGLAAAQGESVRSRRIDIARQHASPRFLLVVTVRGGVYSGYVAFREFWMNWHDVGLALSLGFRRCTRAYVCNNVSIRHVFSGNERGCEEILKKEKGVV